jgi:vacuolar-type H+-ATPase subunit C/Vma6
MAEGERLAGLCRIRDLSEFTRAIFAGQELGLFDFQRLSVSELIRELSGLLEHLSGPGVRLLNWVLVRFQVENLKVLIRLCITESSMADLQKYLAPLPRGLALDDQGLVALESLVGLTRLVPRGPLRESLKEAIESYGDHPRPFFFEAALDHAYFQVLLARVEDLIREDREIVEPMVCQEVDIFHLALVARGRFHYGLTQDLLLPLHVAGSRIHRALFAEMLNEQDLPTSMSRAAGRLFDATPSERGSIGGSEAAAFDVATFERLAWRRFLRLANLAFRQSHMGLGTVVGYAGIHRMEVANLITISEGIQKGMTAEAILAHLILPTGGEAFHV